MTPNKRDLKAYVRFDGSGRVVPGSLVLRRKMPKVGKWMEIQTYECCGPYPPPVFHTFNLTSGASAENACSATETTPLYCGDDTIGLGSVLFTNNTLTTPVENGWYSDGTNAYEVTGDFGQVTAIETCPSPTTTSSTTAAPTTTSTTTGTPVSDMRLKENIVPTGNYIGQLPEYTWTWNATAKALGVDIYPTKGVLAQEAMEVNPDFVMFDQTIGYLRVNYSAINAQN